MDKRKRLIYYVSYTMLAVIVLSLLFYAHKLELINISCMLYKITGLYCPGCGITRMVQSLIELNIYQALRYNPFIMTSIPICIYIYIRCGVEYIQSGRVKSKSANLILYYAIALVTFGILRNLEWFSLLAPTKIY